MSRLAALLATLLILSLAYVVPRDPLRVIAFLSMGIAMSSISVLVYYKRLEFLVAESVHVSFFSVTLGYIANYFTNIPVLVCATATGLLIIYVAMLLAKQGLSQEKASATIVSATSALSVILAQYALTVIPARYSLSSIILGDPLLLSRWEALLATGFSIAVFAVVFLFIREIIEISISPISASLAGIKVNLYEVLTYTIIGLTSIILLKLAGYVMEHVLMLMPALASVSYSNNLKEHCINSILLGLLAATAGLALSIPLNVAPTGLAGLIVLLVFLIGYIKSRK